MDNFHEEQPRGWMFGGSVLGTVAIGLVLAGMAIYYFRTHPAPEPVVIKPPPETVIVEKPAPAPRLEPIKLPPPPPPLPPPPPPPPAKIEAVMSVWDGVWRKAKYPMPMFELHGFGDSVDGKYAPNWSGVYPIQDATIIGDTVEFTVEDQILRAHFRMTMRGPDKAIVEGWNTEEDILAGVEKANRMRLSRQQALVVRIVLEGAASRKGQPMSLGIFVRVHSDQKR